MHMPLCMSAANPLTCGRICQRSLHMCLHVWGVWRVASRAENACYVFLSLTRLGSAFASAPTARRRDEGTAFAAACPGLFTPFEPFRVSAPALAALDWAMGGSGASFAGGRALASVPDIFDSTVLSFFVAIVTFEMVSNGPSFASLVNRLLERPR